MPAKKLFTREEGAKLVETEIKKMASAMRDAIKSSDIKTLDDLMQDQNVWYWLNSARHIIERIQK